MNKTVIKYDSFEQALDKCGEYVTQVRGVSMYPMLRYMKDPVLIHPLVGALKPYDVVVYARGDRYVVHRVLEVREKFCIIRGDNCVAKEYVPMGAIRGIVVGFWRFNRYIPVTDRMYLAYSHLWVAINPLVRLHHRLKSVAMAILHRAKGILKKCLPLPDSYRS